MAFILTFLGKDSIGRATVAIATARKFANNGSRVLLIGQDSDPTLGALLETPLSADPQTVMPNLQAVQFQTATLLERSWEEVKKLEAQYLRTPILKSVFAQELGVIPGMDMALALNALREYNASDRFDVIIYDGSGDQSTLRMFGLPETLSWYIRRFRQVFSDSDLGKTVLPFLQPLVGSVLNVDLLSDNFGQPTNQVNNILEQGKAALADPQRVAAYLVTTSEALDVATARYLWGSAQQIGLTVAGVIVNPDSVVTQEVPDLQTAFAPLTISPLPPRLGQDWQPLMDALPDFSQTAQAPRPMTISIPERKVSLFLPGFDKKQVKLTQNGPEVTIEAGDQRRNISLPPELSGRPVSGAKFQDAYLVISFG